MAPSNTLELAKETARYLQASLPPELREPAIAIICGSGLGGLTDAVEVAPRSETYYRDIPYFPRSTGMSFTPYEDDEDRWGLIDEVCSCVVQGHTGKLLFGRIGLKGTPAVFMVGRAHFYEGHAMEQITLPIRVLKLLGVQTMIDYQVTNAAGGLNESYNVGDIVILGDHLFLAGLAGTHPLRGPNEDSFGPRFPALSDAYDLELRRLAHQVWKKMARDQASRQLHEGVYAFVGGPSYETRAECRMLQILGADLVGMSTVPEIIVARHCGIRVLALSLVTNKAVLDPGPRGDDTRLEFVKGEQLNEVIGKGKANHQEVIEAGQQAAKDMQVIKISSPIEILQAEIPHMEALVQEFIDAFFDSKLDDLHSWPEPFNPV